MTEYIIERVEKYPVFTETGQVVYHYRIYFKDTQTGITDFVDVPEEKYNSDYVRKLILERIKTHREIYGSTAK